MTVLIPKLSTQDSAHRAARVNQPDQVLNPSAGRRRMLNARRARGILWCVQVVSR